MNKDYYTADTEEQQQQFLDYLNNDVGLLAVDTETTGLDSFGCRLMGVSISATPGEAFYFPVSEFKNGEVTWIDSKRLDLLCIGLTKLLCNSNAKLIMHNSVFDVWVLRNNLSIDTLPQLFCDTLLLKHTVDEQKPHSLKDIAVRYFGEDAKDEQTDLKESVLANGGKWNKDNKDMFMADPAILAKYACADTDLTLKIFERLSQGLEEQGLVKFFYEEEVMPLNEVIIENLVGVGIKCDIEYFTKLKDELAIEIVRLEEEAHSDFHAEYTAIYEDFEAALLENEFPLTPRGNLFAEMYIASGLTIYNDKNGNPTFIKKVVEQELKDNPGNALLMWKLGQITDKQFMVAEFDLIYNTRKAMYLPKMELKYVINLGSTKQLQEILFKKLGEEPTFTKKGNATVDVDILDNFAKKYKFLAKVMEWRKATKLLTTYVEGILSSQKEGIVRPNWLQHGTDSGRLSCKNPNFQNLPRDDKRIKHGIIAREGRVLVGADYAQIEPRTFASFSNEQTLIDSFIHGIDFYGTVAVSVFNLKDDPNTLKKTNPNARQESKEIALGIPYGMKKWKLANILGCSIEDAQLKIDKYWKAYPKLNKFMLQCHGEVLTNGFVKADTGRMRRFIGVDVLKGSRSWEDKKILNKLLNLGINFKIQATASGIINRAMIALYRRFKELDMDVKILIQVHDELILECLEKDKEQVCAIVKEVMETIYKLKVPLIAEPIAGYRLSECK